MVKYAYNTEHHRFVKIPPYIYQRRNGWFEIRKRIGGTLIYWGSFPTLEEAKLYRAYYIGKNWLVNPCFHNNRYIKQISDDSFVIVKKFNGKGDYFGIFHDISIARAERDICMKCNWDMDKIVEFGDTIEV